MTKNSILRFTIRTIIPIVLLSVASLPAPAKELRGLWVDAWTMGVKTPEQVSEMVRFTKEQRFNAIFLQVRRRGDVYYESSFEPKARDCAPDFDALKEAVRLGHEAGLEVHAWLVICPVGSKGNSAESRVPSAGKEEEASLSAKQPAHVMVRHLEWLCQDIKGEKLHSQRDYYLDPGIPEVQEFLYNICMEVVRKYPVDGLHLDYFRYPSVTWGYNPLALKRYAGSAECRVSSAELETTRDGKRAAEPSVPAPLDTNWKAWRQKQLTGLLERIRKGVKQVRPQAKLTLAGYSPSGQAYNFYFQDWEAWLEKDLLDYVVPMAFSRDESTWKYRLEDAFSENADKIIVGIGSYLITPETTIAHINDVRKKGGKGFVLYSYGSSAQNTTGSEALIKISEGAFKDGIE